MYVTIEAPDGYMMNVIVEEGAPIYKGGYYCRFCDKFHTATRPEIDELISRNDEARCPNGHKIFSNAHPYDMEEDEQDVDFQFWTEYAARQAVRVYHTAGKEGRWQLVGKVFYVTKDAYRDRNGYCPLHSSSADPGGERCLNPHDHCRHGVYVGGCGPDYMCGRCELGEDDVDRPGR